MDVLIWSLMRRQETSYIDVLRTSKYDVLRICQRNVLRTSTWSCMQQQGTSLTDVIWACPATVTNLVPQHLLAQYIDSDQRIFSKVSCISLCIGSIPQQLQVNSSKEDQQAFSTKSRIV